MVFQTRLSLTTMQESYQTTGKVKEAARVTGCGPSCCSIVLKRVCPSVGRLKLSPN